MLLRLTQHEEGGDRHRVEVREAVQSIEPTVVSDAEARILDVPVFSPALLFERLTTDATGHPVEYAHSLYRGDRYRIVSRLALDGAGRPPVPAGAAAGGGHHPGIPPGDLDPHSAIASSTTGDVHSPA